MVSGAISAFIQACVNSSSCASALGAVSPLDLPSLFTALPLITAWIGSRSSIALSSGFSSNDPIPSPHKVPSACLSNGFNNCSLDSTKPNAGFFIGKKIRQTPPAIAMSHSLLRIAWQASCMASSPDEQAESKTMLGPFRSRK
ncbi:hypothetical protein D3C73_960390 [compost metagenome]